MEKTSLGIETASNVLNITATLMRGTSNVTDIIGLFVPLLNNVTRTVHEIQALCETVEHNKRMCSTLLERVLFAEAATKALMTRPDHYKEKLRTAEFYKNFQKFTNAIEKIKNFVKNVSQASGLRKFFRASDIKSKFAILLEEFDGLMNVLQFSMVVRSSDVNYIILKDLEELKHYMERIEGGITKRDANEILVNPNLEDIAFMNAAWREGTLLANEDSFSSVMISPNLITDNPAGQKGKEIEQAFYNNLATGIEPVALKLVIDPNSAKSEQKKGIMSEILIFKRLKDCKHIIQFYGLVERDTGIYLVTQWADNGHLKKFYTEDHAMAHWSVKTKIAVDIARALTFLHSVSIYHHDLRSENVLITDRCMAKLANFTRSRCFSADTNSMEQTLDRMRYMAPEKVENENQRYNVKCEVFSFGRLLWEIAECKIPFHECQDTLDLKKLVCNSNVVCFSSRVPKEWRDITNKAMRYNPNLRPALSEVFSALFEISENYRTDVLPCQSSICNNGSNSPRRNGLSDLNEELPDDFVDLDLSESYASLQNVMSIQDALKEHKKSNGNKKAALEAFRVHAKHGNNTAKYWYGYYLDNKKNLNLLNSEEKEQRLQKAAALFKETADDGYADGQFRYGYCLWNGTGVPKNVDEAIKYFEMSAEGGNSIGMYYLGDIYYKGLGINKDKEKGVKYLRRAALLNQEKALKICKKERISLT